VIGLFGVPILIRVTSAPASAHNDQAITTAGSGEADTMRTRHRDHYTAVFDAPPPGGLQQRIEQAEVEIDNLRAAFEWSRDNDDSELGLTAGVIAATAVAARPGTRGAGLV
jgi:predicted ATPase